MTGQRDYVRTLPRTAPAVRRCEAAPDPPGHEQRIAALAERMRQGEAEAVAKWLRGAVTELGAKQPAKGA